MIRKVRGRSFLSSWVLQASWSNSIPDAYSCALWLPQSLQLSGGKVSHWGEFNDPDSFPWFLRAFWQPGVKSSPVASTTVKSQSWKAAQLGEYLIELSCSIHRASKIPGWELTFPEKRLELESWSWNPGVCISHRQVPSRGHKRLHSMSLSAVKLQMPWYFSRGELKEEKYS